MRTEYLVGMAMVAGIAVGGTAIESLHAQAKPIFLITEINTSNLEGYMKDYSPLAQKTIKDAGGRLIAAGPAQSVEGEPPTRVVILAWDSADKMLAWRSSAEYKSAREIGDKLAKFHSYFIPGASQ